MVKKLLLGFAVVIFGLAASAAVAAPTKAQYRLVGSIDTGIDATDKQHQAWNHFFKLADAVTGNEFYAFTFQVEKFGKYQVSFVVDKVIVQANALPMDVQGFQSPTKHRYGVVVSEQLINKLKSSSAPAITFGNEKGLPSDMTRLAL
ncbi:hypothetical protein [Rheinheimera hassiensis]|uniref:hypothetical protein n=1 Tax=Rheinheimera hassiensis TaxID=1193627 RepID=UPI001F05F757|nr:hypothetical protein [Rheinheimera hassiensis]